MNSRNLALDNISLQLMQMYWRFGRLGLICLVSTVSVLVSVGLVLLYAYFATHEVRHFILTELLPLAVIIPLVVASGTSFFVVRLLVHLDRSLDEVTKLSTTDPLTGSANRRGFLVAAEQNIHTLRQAKESMVGMIDMDYFKKINDTLGHKTGDEVLAALAQNLDVEIGGLGFAGRIGGDEFAFIAFGTESELSDLEKRLLNNCVTFETANGVSASASMGIIRLNYGENIEEALARADESLYSIKKNRPAANDNIHKAA